MSASLCGYWLQPNPTLTQRVDHPFTTDDFWFFDKDGFELCNAESLYYAANNIDRQSCLNHTCCQQNWLWVQGDNVFTDHALVLHRYDYSERAREQLELVAQTIPQAKWLLQTKQKWGYDVAIDAFLDGCMFEVVHIERDSYDFNNFEQDLETVQESILRTDWEQAARQVWSHRDSWAHLRGMAQNDWKAKYLFGWTRAEITEKAGI